MNTDNKALADSKTLQDRLRFAQDPNRECHLEHVALAASPYCAGSCVCVGVRVWYVH